MKEIGDLKVWYLSTDLHALNATILIDSKVMNTGLVNVDTLKKIIGDCKINLTREYNFEYMNIQVEFTDSISNANHFRESVSIGKF